MEIFPVSYELILCPAKRAFNGTFPTCVKIFPLVCTHTWFKSAINGPLLGEFVWTFPKADCQTCEIGCTESGRLCNLWTLYCDTEDISLKLHKQVISNCTTIDTQCSQMNVTVSGH